MNLPDFLTENADGFIHFTGSRVGIGNVLHYYKQGHSAETLACEYESLSLPLIHKLIAFYLENRDEVDTYLDSCREELDQQMSAQAGPSLKDLRQRMANLQQA